ncbi:CDP-glycerol glycerophosphotransferase family protein [Alteromonas gracilis]|uniref:CDP-glycerol glycerophosphotransferase family protein n=1 Tax=Alteromonas gracilis TaxID=1479524 RepID=UPI00321BAB27
MASIVLFDVQHLYYLPQYLPVAKVLKSQDVEVRFILHKEAGYDEIKAQKLDEEQFDYCFISGKSYAFEFYKQQEVDWIIFGNVPPFPSKDKALLHAKLALMQHGIGPKSCYYKVSEYPFDVRFVEGESRLARLTKLFPQRTFVNISYAKLDPLYDGSPAVVSLEDLGLDPAKPTVLYAPTFFPSSIERFDDNWPSALSDFNIILKPHFFSMTKEKYAAQKSKLKRWSSYDNVYLTQKSEFCLVSFMKIADVMLSDASSAIFEFAAINKPVVWCDFTKKKWNYTGLFKFRMNKRLDSDIAIFHDIAHHASNPVNANKLLRESVNAPHAKSSERLSITRFMVGEMDGKCSSRIAHYLTTNNQVLPCEE